MLNELFTLDRSLARFEVPVEQSHPWVKRLGRANLLIAGINPSGQVASIEPRDKQEAVKLFKIQESNHANFPAVNWPAPIWELDAESPSVQEWLACPEKEVSRRTQLLRKACEGAAESPEQRKMLVNAQKFVRELAPRFTGRAEGDFIAFPTLMKRFAAATLQEWPRSLSDAALHAADTGSPETLKSVETLLAGGYNKKTGKFERQKAPIFFDLSDCTDSKFRYRVADPRTGSFFGRVLHATETAGPDNGRCALTGLEMPLVTDKFPSPRLPQLGDTVILSMNPDTPCQIRYGRIGTEIFPVGKRTADNLNDAILYLTGANREGKNWSRIPGTIKKKLNLLIVYLESTPDLDAQIADAFCGGQESETLYETLSSKVCSALRALPSCNSQLLHLFVLNKIDPGRVQVELSDTFTAEQAIRGSEEWRAGARNRPPLPLKKDTFDISPTQAVRCLQMQWERDAASYSDAPGCRLAKVFDLLIAGRPDAHESARSLLHLTLQRNLNLLSAIGHAAHRGGKEAWTTISRDAGNYPVVAASLLGITVNKLGYRKEIYMSEPAFLVGRFLSLVDTLHAEYSRTVRDDLPPQLLGNALIPTAIGNPTKAIARSKLLRVYQAWARGKTGTGLARWSCREMGRIAVQAAEQLPNRRLTEVEQAQLVLGYLAREEKKEEADTEEGAN